LINAGTIDADVAGKILTIHTGNTITNAGLMEATNTGILDVQDNVNNSGLLEASGGSELDITGNTISWDGGAPNAGSNGILLAGTGDTLLVDSSTGTLTLNGTTANGAVSLGTGSQIIATTAGQTLDNVNNVISGAGAIGNDNGDLTLDNETAGTIDANVAGQMLTIHTGNTITNAGLLEATGGGTLEIADGVDDTTGTIAIGSNSTLTLIDSSSITGN